MLQSSAAGVSRPYKIRARLLDLEFEKHELCSGSPWRPSWDDQFVVLAQFGDDEVHACDTCLYRLTRGVPGEMGDVNNINNGATEE